MIAQDMRRIESLLLLCALFLAACGDSSPLSCSRPLPFPTPGQQDLVVVTTSAPLISSTDEAGHISGLTCDLANAFAQELNVGVKFVILPPDQVDQELATGKTHIAAVWRSPPSAGRLKASPPIANTRDLLIQHEASFALGKLSDLSGKTVTVVT